MLEDSNVKSFSYVISLMTSGGSGNRDMYRLNNVDDNTPCGTPCLILLYLELMFLNVTYVCLPGRYFPSHLYIVGGNMVSRMILKKIPMKTLKVSYQEKI